MNKCKKELINCKRTINNYRKAVTDMQKDFFTGGAKGGPPSSITMTSIGKTSNVMKREVSHMDEFLQLGGERPQVADDAMSSTSGMREKDLKDSANKVQQFLETNATRSMKQSSQ